MPKKSPESHSIDRKAVNYFESVILDLDWIFRKQTENDYGIDAEIEVKNEKDEVTGEIFKAQIKGTKNIKIRGNTVSYSLDRDSLSYVTQEIRTTGRAGSLGKAPRRG